MPTTITKPIILNETGQQIVTELQGIRSAISQEPHTVYGYHVDNSESDPSAKVTYLRDAVGMTPAKMNYTTGVFDYGSWGSAFFMPRPCMVRQSGGVAYYLDANNYAKKENGTASDVANTSYAGNAMMEWGQGGKRIWYKIVPDAVDPRSYSVYVSDIQADSEFVAWNFINNQGKMTDHFYTPIYNGSMINSTLRSLSGCEVAGSIEGGQEAEVTAALANNKSSNILWFTETYADRLLITILLTLMGKSTATQSVFGNGLSVGDQSALSEYRTGALNTNGLFYGYNDETHAVKTFGMENFWGAQWRRVAGLLYVSGLYRIKMTYGRQDGSSADGYNVTGNGYITEAAPSITGTSNGFISAMSATNNGIYPIEASGASATHYCDAVFYNNTSTRCAFFGGSSSTGNRNGAFATHVSLAPTATNWDRGASLSYKPLA